MNGKPTFQTSVRIGLRLCVAMISCAVLFGCEEPKHISRAKPAPTTQPTAPVIVAVAPTTAPSNVPAIQPAIAETIFQVDGTLYHFPRARIHIDAKNNSVVLYSDDPKSAIEPGYAGNSFYLVIPLDKNNPLKLDHYQWNFRAESGGDQRDATEGIFLNGQRNRLQPQDVHVAFLGDGPSLKFWLWGQFE